MPGRRYTLLQNKMPLPAQGLSAAIGAPHCRENGMRRHRGVVGHTGQLPGEKCQTIGRAFPPPISTLAPGVPGRCPGPNWSAVESVTDSCDCPGFREGAGACPGSRCDNFNLGLNMFVILWQFDIAEEKIPAFEAAYGADGTWSALFARS